MKHEYTEPSIHHELLQKTYEAHEAFARFESPVRRTHLYMDRPLSKQYQAEIWMASELHQPISAFKIRGAYNFMRQQSPGTQVVTSSAGNHGQGIAYSSYLLGVKSTVFMPANTPKFKVDKVRFYGDDHVDVKLVGSTFDEANTAAQEYCNSTERVFAHPFDNLDVIAGQGTIGLEVAEKGLLPDMLVCPVGGGGLVGGIGNALKSLKKNTEIVGVEPQKAASMSYALDVGYAKELPEPINGFVDGVAVRKVGSNTLKIAQLLDIDMVKVSNGDARKATSELWERGIQSELAGSIAVAGLDKIRGRIAGKTILCIISGGNLSQERFAEEVETGIRDSATPVLN